ncbi:MAG: twin-arginine translocation signal domain-containing protein [Bacteroidales bacterium]|nr:twin-arginine translocation signal domain-containing protein [Bacteroidales bacterium]MBO7479924.1 twin-arginine translocation signal domain-containing protein [Bacteroidales bacterium]
MNRRDFLKRSAALAVAALPDMATFMSATSPGPICAMPSPSNAADSASPI